MKHFISISFRSLVAASLIAAVCSRISASTLVCSNLVADDGGNVNRLIDSHGVPLAAGSWVQLGTFGNLSPAEISELALQGHQPLLAAFSPIGAASSIGLGSSPMAGRIEFAGSSPMSQPVTGLHVVVFNAPTPAAASEVLIAALPGTLPADDQSGLQGYLAVHLDNATPVVGMAGENGLATAVFVSGFQAWWVGQNVSGVSPELQLPGGDADQDGDSNLMEYALGSLAGDPASRANSELMDIGGAIRLRFLGRNDDGEITLAVETSEGLDAASWSEIPGPLVGMVSPPSPAPSGYSWYEVVIPKSGARLFARVRVSLNP